MIELIVVLAIVGLLLTLVVPRFGTSISATKEAVLRENLLMVRKAIDQHYADSGQYPKSLVQLVEKRYLRDMPIDPITNRSDTWELISATSSSTEEGKTPAATPSTNATSAKDGQKQEPSQDPKAVNGGARELPEGFRDIRSTSELIARDGSAYASW